MSYEATKWTGVGWHLPQYNLPLEVQVQVIKNVQARAEIDLMSLPLGWFHGCQGLWLSVGRYFGPYEFVPVLRLTATLQSAAVPLSPYSQFEPDLGRVMGNHGLDWGT